MTAPDTTAPGEASPTYYDRPAIKEPVWIWSVPVYFHVGGVTAGAALLGAVSQLADRDGLAELITRCRQVAAVGAGASTALLIHDLGRPGRFLNMLRVFRPTSAMSVGSWTLAASGTLAGAAATLPGRVGDAAGLGAGAFAGVLGTYTGVLLSDTAVPVWHRTRRQLPPLFGASALAGTAALLDLLPLDGRGRSVTTRIGVIAGGAEIAAARATERAADVHERVGRPLHDGASGTLWRLASILTVVSTLLRLLPLPTSLRRIRRVLAGVLGTLAGLALRVGILQAGVASARDPRATFEPQRTGG